MSEQPQQDLSPSFNSANQPHFTDPLRALIDFVEEADQILEMSLRGISTMTAMPKAMEALKRAKEEEYTKNERDRVENLALFAKKEIERDFQLLHAHTVVAIWSALEACILRFASRSLTDNPVKLLVPAFDKIEIPVSSYEQMSTDGPMNYVVNAILQEQRIGRPGVARYEELLDTIGFGCDICDDLRSVRDVTG